MKYFFDNCISYRFARMLAALEEWEEVVALRDRFEEDIADVDLFRELKGSDYVFIRMTKSSEAVRWRRRRCESLG